MLFGGLGWGGSASHTVLHTRGPCYKPINYQFDYYSQKSTCETWNGPGMSKFLSITCGACNSKIKTMIVQSVKIILGEPQGHQDMLWVVSQVWAGTSPTIQTITFLISSKVTQEGKVLSLKKSKKSRESERRCLATENRFDLCHLMLTTKPRMSSTVSVDLFNQ